MCHNTKQIMMAQKTFTNKSKNGMMNVVKPKTNQTKSILRKQTPLTDSVQTSTQITKLRNPSIIERPTLFVANSVETISTQPMTNQTKSTIRRQTPLTVHPVQTSTQITKLRNPSITERPTLFVANSVETMPTQPMTNQTKYTLRRQTPLTVHPVQTSTQITNLRNPSIIERTTLFVANSVETIPTQMKKLKPAQTRKQTPMKIHSLKTEYTKMKKLKTPPTRKQTPMTHRSIERATHMKNKGNPVKLPVHPVNKAPKGKENREPKTYDISGATEHGLILRDLILKELRSVRVDTDRQQPRTPPILKKEKTQPVQNVQNSKSTKKKVLDSKKTKLGTKPAEKYISGPKAEKITAKNGINSKFSTNTKKKMEISTNVAKKQIKTEKQAKQKRSPLRKGQKSRRL
ncbi:hypothetical protein WDU94_006910 [Cyamophila willieti]